jgi:hypothetical protein
MFDEKIMNKCQNWKWRDHGAWLHEKREREEIGARMRA